MTEPIEKSCENCKYINAPEDGEPCRSCKHGMPRINKKYDTAPILWSPGPTEEKRMRIEDYCTDFPVHCDDCPVHAVLKPGENYYSEGADIERNYNLLFGSADRDMVNHPSHYETGKYECIDVMVESQGAEAVMSYCICNAFKYIYRHMRKNGVEDVKKARWYLDKYLELMEEAE